MPARREVLKWLASLPFVGTLAGTGMVKNVAGTPLMRPVYRRNFFRELGLRPFINGRGTITALSGSLMPPEVMEAMNYASQQFVDLNELQRRVGERIAAMLRCEAAMVTAGAASAMTLATAAAITGTDRELIRLVPNLKGPQREVIIQRSHRFGYDHAIRNAGVKLVEVEGPDEMEQAINERTVLMLFYNAAGRHSVSKTEFVRIGKKHRIPTFNDAAADVPPVENLFKYIEMGFDLVTFSGGKAIRGPQSAGLLYGRKDLIEAALLNNNPNADTIGRGMKVNKEEILAMMVALEVYLQRDHEHDWQQWEAWVARIASEVEKLPHVTTVVYVPAVANHVPHLRVRWDQQALPVSGAQLVQALRYGHPSIEVAGGGNSISISVFMMQPEEIEIVGRRVRETLQQAMASVLENG